MPVRIFGCILLFVLSLLALGCHNQSTEPSSNLLATPVVKKTATNYTLETFEALFPDTVSLQTMSEEYSGHYSEQRREAVLMYMREEVDHMGENTSRFAEMLARMGCTNSEMYILPTYAERARYENQAAWMLQFTYGLGTPNFGHYKCFAIAVESLDTLAYLGCR